jgi:inositol phosphorylceramide mannosyltransferase catalytic subunit
MASIMTPAKMKRRIPPPVVLITLKRTPERTQRGLERLRKAGVNPIILWGSDGADPDEYQTMPRDPKCAEIRHHMQPGEVGCCMSWWRACAMIIHKGWDLAVILEDDAEPMAPLMDLYNALLELPNNFDVALLHNQHSPEPLPAQRGHTLNFRRVLNGSWTTAAVCISNTGARKLIKRMPPFDRPIDVLIGGQFAPFHERIEEVDQHPYGLVLYQPHAGKGWFRQDHWKPSTVRPNSQAGRIPKVIHRIWVGGKPPPPEYYDYWRSWGNFHPKWQRRTWDDAALAKEWPRNLALQRANGPAEKSDMARLLILQRFGGLYVDTDFECLHCFDEILGAASVLIGDMQEGIACNGFMASVPGHKLMEELVTRASANMIARNGGILHKAGPEMLKSVLAPWRNYWRKDLFVGEKRIATALADSGVVILEPWVLFPYLWTQPRPKNYGDAWAAHHWARSWWGPKEWEEHRKEMLTKRGTAAA